MRIVAGSLRGRRLASPPGRDIRPTGERARQAVFNILEHGGLGPDGGSVLRDAQVLDAFAGTGAMGLEALSRGAAAAVFLESDREALWALRRNVGSCGVDDRAAILPANVLNPPSARQPCGLVFLDPPYGQDLAAPALAALDVAGWIERGGLCVVETGPEDRLTDPVGFTRLDERRYGKARVAFLRYGSV